MPSWFESLRHEPAQAPRRPCYCGRCEEAQRPFASTEYETRTTGVRLSWKPSGVMRSLAPFYAVRGIGETPDSGQLFNANIAHNASVLIPLSDGGRGMSRYSCSNASSKINEIILREYDRAARNCILARPALQREWQTQTLELEQVPVIADLKAFQQFWSFFQTAHFGGGSWQQYNPPTSWKGSPESVVAGITRTEMAQCIQAITATFTGTMRIAEQLMGARIVYQELLGHQRYEIHVRDIKPECEQVLQNAEVMATILSKLAFLETPVLLELCKKAGRLMAVLRQITPVVHHLKDVDFLDQVQQQDVVRIDSLAYTLRMCVPSEGTIRQFQQEASTQFGFRFM